MAPFLAADLDRLYEATTPRQRIAFLARLTWARIARQPLLDVYRREAYNLRNPKAVRDFALSRITLSQIGLD